MLNSLRASNRNDSCLLAVQNERYSRNYLGLPVFSHISNAANAQFSILDAHFFRFALTKGAAIISDYGRVAEIGVDTCLVKVGVSSNVRVPMMHKSIIH